MPFKLHFILPKTKGKGNTLERKNCVDCKDSLQKKNNKMKCGKGVKNIWIILNLSYGTNRGNAEGSNIKN